MKVFKGSDMRFEVVYTNEATDTAITTGTLTATIFDDRSGAQLGSPIAGAHVTNGLWAFIIPDTLAGVDVGQRLRIQVVFDGGADLMSRKLYYAQVVEDENF